MLAAKWNTEIVVPGDECASMALIKIPSAPGLPVTTNGAEYLHDELWHRYKIEVHLTTCDSPY